MHGAGRLTPASASPPPRVIASAAWQSPTYRADLLIGDCHVVPPRNDVCGKTRQQSGESILHRPNQKILKFWFTHIKECANFAACIFY
jgi:hypothetical protein